MEKYAVVIDDEKQKTGGVQDKNTCPKCGATYDLSGPIPLCPNCGTEPFEKTTQEKR